MDEAEKQIDEVARLLGVAPRPYLSRKNVPIMIGTDATYDLVDVLHAMALKIAALERPT